MNHFKSYSHNGDVLNVTFHPSPWSKNGEFTRSFTEEQLTLDQIVSWLQGKAIQCAMPNLSPTEREMFLSGMTESEQDALFKDEEDEEDEDE